MQLIRVFRNRIVVSSMPTTIYGAYEGLTNELEARGFTPINSLVPVTLGWSKSYEDPDGPLDELIDIQRFLWNLTGFTGANIELLAYTYEDYQATRRALELGGYALDALMVRSPSGQTPLTDKIREISQLGMDTKEHQSKWRDNLENPSDGTDKIRKFNPTEEKDYSTILPRLHDQSNSQNIIGPHSDTGDPVLYHDLTTYQDRSVYGDRFAHTGMDLIPTPGWDGRQDLPSFPHLQSPLDDGTTHSVAKLVTDDPTPAPVTDSIELPEPGTGPEPDPITDSAELTEPDGPEPHV